MLTNALSSTDTSGVSQSLPECHLSVDQVLAGLDAALTKLKENMKSPHEALERKIYVNKAIGDGFVALLPVSAFIAGVQGQVVASTLESNNDAVSVASNWFGFNGLVLDILGTVFGAVRLLSLQRSTRGAERNRQRIEASFNQLSQYITLIKTRVQDPQEVHTSFGTILGEIDRAIEQQKDLMEYIEKLYLLQLPSLFDPSPVNILPAHGMLARWVGNNSRIKSLFGHMNIIIQRVEQIFVAPVKRPRSTIPDQVPMIVMGLGVIFLLMSVILQAVATQFRRVWLGCIILTGIVCLYAAPGIMETDDGHSSYQGKIIDQKMAEFVPKAGDIATEPQTGVRRIHQVMSRAL